MHPADREKTDENSADDFFSHQRTGAEAAFSSNPALAVFDPQYGNHRLEHIDAKLQPLFRCPACVSLRPLLDGSYLHPQLGPFTKRCFD